MAVLPPNEPVNILRIASERYEEAKLRLHNEEARQYDPNNHYRYKAARYQYCNADSDLDRAWDFYNYLLSLEEKEG